MSSQAIIREMKQLVSARKGLEPGSFMILHENVELPDEITLDQAGIVDNTSLRAVFKLI